MDIMHRQAGRLVFLADLGARLAPMVTPVFLVIQAAIFLKYEIQELMMYLLISVYVRMEQLLFMGFVKLVQKIV